MHDFKCIHRCMVVHSSSNLVDVVFLTFFQTDTLNFGCIVKFAFDNIYSN